MKLKIRGADLEYLNSSLEGKHVDVFVGLDSEGNEVYTGDIVTKDGEDYRVALVVDFDFISTCDSIYNYKLKG